MTPPPPWDMGPLTDPMARCNRCGFCQDVCPTYGATLSEMDVARGRIQTLRLIQSNQLDPMADKAVLQQADQCLLCGACVAHCPSSVPTDRLMQQTRSRIQSALGFSLFHTLIYRGLLGPQERLEKITRLIHLLDRGLKTHRLRNGIARTAALKARTLVSDGLTYLPSPVPGPARLDKTLIKKEGGTGRITYFLGCGTNVFTPSVALSAIGLLDHLGYQVSVPRFPCCGGPHFASGDMEKAQCLALKNLALLEAQDPEAIVTDCATCAHTLADYPAFFPQDHPAQETIARLAPRVKDINTFLVEQLVPAVEAIAPEQDRPLKVTYHDPCHAVRGLGVVSQPRRIIQALPGLELVEMEGADSCCGGAGSYAFRHPEMSRRILEKKIQAIEETGADILATSCPSCTLQMGAGLRRAGLDIQVRHPMELAWARLNPGCSPKQDPH